MSRLAAILSLAAGTRCQAQIVGGCLAPPPPAEASGAPQLLTFATVSNAFEICANPTGERSNSTIIYFGRTCTNKSSASTSSGSILWTKLTNMNPRPGCAKPAGANVSWDRSNVDNVPRWFGFCGVPPTALPNVPGRLCSHGGRNSTAQSQQPLLLFVDNSTVASFDPRLTYRVHRPARAGRAIAPTEPWENQMVYAYTHVLNAGPGDYRMYYDCVQANLAVVPNVPLGRRICLALSNDGITWRKPHLGVFPLPSAGGSRANNIILWSGSQGSVFIDRKAGVPASQRYKLVCSKTDAQDDWNQTGAVWASPDGKSNWTELPFQPLHNRDDTKPTANYDPRIGKYVISVRRDVPVSGKSADVVRQIGRCETDNISDWQKEYGGRGCPVVFGPDSDDPDHADMYTNAWTPYPSIEHPSAIHLFFPSIFSHVAPIFPGFSGDGLLDIRLVVSTDTGGRTLHYPPAPNARSPFVTLGVNSCGLAAPSMPGGWCDAKDGAQARTAFDTSNIYMASGWIPSMDGEQIYLYYSGEPFTHGDLVASHSFGNNTGIGRLVLRKDGFVSVDAPYAFHYKSLDEFPSFTTRVVKPTTCRDGDRLFAVINAVTSVVGFVAIAVLRKPGGVEVPGFELQVADKITGNSISARLTWANNTRADLSSIAKSDPIAFKVVMADASLYSITFSCQ